MVRRLLNVTSNSDQEPDVDKTDGLDDTNAQQHCPKCGGAMIIDETFTRGQTPRSHAPPWEDAA
jgi:predicted RNA-binding Zn-ribbon protein involved in translation (DUF1610 family)